MITVKHEINEQPIKTIGKIIQMLNDKKMEFNLFIESLIDHSNAAFIPLFPLRANTDH